MLKETFADKTVDNGDGTTTTVSFDLKAEYKENVSDKDLKEGENIIEINNTDQPDKGNGRTVWDKRDKTAEEKPINKNDLAWIHTRHSYVNSHDWISTATHEIGHTLGLNDRYKGNTGNPHDGFGNDLMGSGVYNLVPAHYADWSQYGINQNNNNQQNKQMIINYIDLNRRTAPKPKN